MQKLYVVCLFLPNTLSFDLDEKNSIKLNPKRSSYKAAEPVPHLIQKLASCSEGRQDIKCDSSLSKDSENQFFYDLKNTNVLENKKKQENGDEVFEGPRKELNQPKFSSHILPSIAVSKISMEKSPNTMTYHPHVPILTSKRRRSSFDITLFSRVPWTIEFNDQSNSGLANAVRAAYKSCKLYEHMFIGLLGIPTDSLSVSRKNEIEQRFIKECQSIPIFVSDNEFDNHYNYYCKQILWPIFHYQTPDVTKFKMYQDYSWSHYVALNQAFADKIVEVYKEGDIIWVNDYHLLLVPQMVRQKLCYAMIGFFLHVSFPSYEVFRCLSVRKQLLEGILGANVIGFQTDEYSYQFRHTCAKLLNVETSQGIQLKSSFVNIISLPIGIDPENLEKEKASNSVNKWIPLLKERYAGKSLIVGRDKMDEIRGVRQKLLAFELFLSKNPEWREKVVLIQVALSTSEENEIQSQVSNIVTRINSTYGNLSYQHQPVVFLRQDITISQYLALLTIADALLVTSLREGMNLTSHEFIYCQSKNHGPLIISEFVGSATRFKDSAIIVNPWNFEQVSNAIFQALTMSNEERLQRWNKLSDTIMHHNATHWAMNFINEIKCSHFFEQKKNTLVPKLQMDFFHQKYNNSEVRVFFFDYEGIFLNLKDDIDYFLKNQLKILSILSSLTSDLKNIVYIISRSYIKNIKEFFENVPDLGFITEEGHCIYHPIDNQVDLLSKNNTAWKFSVKEILSYYSKYIPGSYIEESPVSIIFHYNSEIINSHTSWHVDEFIKHINDSFYNLQCHIVFRKNLIIIQENNINKIFAISKTLEYIKSSFGNSKKIDFISIIGDNKNDENVFEWATKLEVINEIKHILTVNVGTSITMAHAWVDHISEYFEILEKIVVLSSQNG